LPNGILDYCLTPPERPRLPRLADDLDPKRAQLAYRCVHVQNGDAEGVHRGSFDASRGRKRRLRKSLDRVNVFPGHPGRVKDLDQNVTATGINRSSTALLVEAKRLSQKSQRLFTVRGGVVDVAKTGGFDHLSLTYAGRVALCSATAGAVEIVTFPPVDDIGNVDQSAYADASTWYLGGL
jgi:hypothetical protein